MGYRAGSNADLFCHHCRTTDSPVIFPSLPGPQGPARGTVLAVQRREGLLLLAMPSCQS